MALAVINKKLSMTRSLLVAFLYILESLITNVEKITERINTGKEINFTQDRNLICYHIISENYEITGYMRRKKALRTNKGGSISVASHET
jgi:hypothetical protein